MVACGSPAKRQSAKKHHGSITCYRQHSMSDNGLDTWLFLYIMTMDNGRYYYYTSPTQISSFAYNNVSWQKSENNPVDNIGKDEIEQIELDQKQQQQLSDQVQEKMDENPEYFEGMTQDEMGDYEGTSTSGDEDKETEDNSQGESESSGSEGGSDSGSDSGGGDSGGGD